MRGIHRSPVNSPHKCQWRGALMFSLIYASTNSWANNGDAGDLRRHHSHYNVIVMNGNCYMCLIKHCIFILECTQVPETKHWMSLAGRWNRYLLRFVFIWYDWYDCWNKYKFGDYKKSIVHCGSRLGFTTNAFVKLFKQTCILDSWHIWTRVRMCWGVLSIVWDTF